LKAKLASHLAAAFFLCIVSIQSAFCPAPLNDALLWEISGPALEKPSYLFGTIHVLCPNDFSLSNTLKEKLTSTEKLIMEINLGEINLSNVNPSLMAMEPNQTLKELLDPEVYTKLKDYVKMNAGIDIALYNNIKPIFLSSLLLSILLECTPLSVENLLLEEASLHEIDTDGLESLSTQLEILSKVPMELQINSIEETMQDLPQAKEEFRKLIALYNKESIRELYELIKDSEFQTYEATLLSNRNEDWIPKMKTAMASSPVFFAVGAGHLAGERGVIRLLENAGYTLQPVPMY
jgi:uncharacterized protein YbaP (TraB family)